MFFTDLEDLASKVATFDYHPEGWARMLMANGLLFDADGTDDMILVRSVVKAGHPKYATERQLHGWNEANVFDAILRAAPGLSLAAGNGAALFTAIPEP